MTGAVPNFILERINHDILFDVLILFSFLSLFLVDTATVIIEATCKSDKVGLIFHFRDESKFKYDFGRLSFVQKNRCVFPDEMSDGTVQPGKHFPE